MNEITNELPKILISVCHDLGLEPHKKIKLENNSQFGYYLKIARNVILFLFYFIYQINK